MREGVVIGVLLFGTLVFAGLFSSCQSRDPFFPTGLRLLFLVLTPLRL